jgi:non-ribosomal peptide synthetase component F
MPYLRSAAERYSPTPEDRFTQLFDLTFDLSVHDMFLCWGSGGALYCPPHSAKMVPRNFVRRHNLTFWFSVPSSAALLSRLKLLSSGDFPSLRWSLFCGEPLSRQLALAWALAAPNSQIENLYGPTEATIAITAYRLPSTADAIGRLPDIVPIGHPLPGQQAVILGVDDQQMRFGEDGELCAGGTQVTDGYWDNPGLTSERFVRLPGCNAISWYRTGDRAKLTSQHGLIFLGRMDRQVKIAGHRVELQEVESALRQVTASDCVAAIAWPVDEHDLARGIVAFVATESRPDGEILAACREVLPTYMVPARIDRLNDWPLNPSGKTDYKQLHKRLKKCGFKS